MINEIHHGDCLQVLKTLADNSVDLITTDPPYFRVKGEAWDNQWASAAAFLEWIGALCVEWRRVLKPNGSLYVFASPQMAAGVSQAIGKHFNVLNDLVWVKEAGFHKRQNKEGMRGYFPQTERIIFAEHFGADNMAKGEAGYAAKCDELRGFVFEPLRAYLADACHNAGYSVGDVQEKWRDYAGTNGVFKCLSRAEWRMVTERTYNFLACLCGGLSHSYEELRQQYEELRQQYEQLRRPFAVTADVPYTDVWTFATVQAYKGKHVCEKPAALMEHIIASSSRPGAVVLDCFMGSNATGKAARKLGRAYIGIELDAHWVAKAEADRAANWYMLPRPAAEPPATAPLRTTHPLVIPRPQFVPQQLTFF